MVVQCQFIYGQATLYITLALFTSNPARTELIDGHSLPCSNKHGVNLAAPQEMRRLIMHILSADFAMEWLRPMPPNVKLVGPLLPEPPKALPADIEVSQTKSLGNTSIHSTCDDRTLVP